MRRILTVTLAAAMLLALVAAPVGCGGSGAPAPAQTTAAAATTAAATTAAAAAETEAAATEAAKDDAKAETTTEAAKTEAKTEKATEAKEEVKDAAAAGSLPLANIKIIVAGDEPIDQQRVFDEVEARTRDTLNIKLAAVYTPWGDYHDKHQLMGASGEEYDIFLNFQFDMQLAFQRGEAIRLNDLIAEYGKDILANISPDDMKSGYVGGDLLAIPAVYFKDSIYETILVRKDLREKYNCPPITDAETMATYLDAIAENEPGMIASLGWAARRAHEIDFFGDRVWNWYGFGVTTNTTPGYWFEDGDDAWVVKSYYEEEGYQKPLRDYTVRGFQSGWWPYDVDNVQKQEGDNAFIAGKTALEQRDLYHFTRYVTEIEVEGAEIEWTVMYPNKPIKPDPSNNFAQISSTSKNPDRAMSFLNWIQASQDNYDLWYWGIKGVHYDLDAQGTVVLREGVVGGGTTGSDNPYAPTPWYFKNIKWDRSVNTDAQITIEAMEWNKNAVRKPMPKTSTFKMNLDPVEVEIAQIERVNDELGRTVALRIAQGEADAQAKFIEALYAAGLQKYLDELQRQLDAFVAENGLK